jgi:hypothetical protein
LCYCLLSCVYIVCCLIVVSLYFVCCLIVVPLPPIENPFAVNNNNNNNICHLLQVYPPHGFGRVVLSSHFKTIIYVRSILSLRPHHVGLSLISLILFRSGLPQGRCLSCGRYVACETVDSDFTQNCVPAQRRLLKTWVRVASLQTGQPRYAMELWT